VQVDVPHVERHQLADPDARPVEQLDQCPIPQGTAIGPNSPARCRARLRSGLDRQCLGQHVTVVDGQRVRQSPGGARRGDTDAGIGLAVPFPHQEAEEAAQGGQLPPQGRGRLRPVAIGQKRSYFVDSNPVRARCGGGERSELAHVREVGPSGVGREIAFGAQVKLEGADRLLERHSTGTATRSR
jgi:hypothetical protein